MPTYEQAIAVLSCMVAALIIIAIGKIALMLFGAIGNALAALLVAVKGVLVTALVGGVIVAITAVALMGTGVVTMPTNQIAPTTTPAPRPTAVRVAQLDVELERMSILEAQRYGAGFKFRNDADNGVCVLQSREGQTWLVANCD